VSSICEPHCTRVSVSLLHSYCTNSFKLGKHAHSKRSWHVDDRDGTCGGAGGARTDSVGLCSSKLDFRTSGDQSCVHHVLGRDLSLRSGAGSWNDRGNDCRNRRWINRRIGGRIGGWCKRRRDSGAISRTIRVRTIDAHVKNRICQKVALRLGVLITVVVLTTGSRKGGIVGWHWCGLRRRTTRGRHWCGIHLAHTIAVVTPSHRGVRPINKITLSSISGGRALGARVTK
jgi:hypothetical protein